MSGLIAGILIEKGAVGGFASEGGYEWLEDRIGGWCKGVKGAEFVGVKEGWGGFSGGREVGVVTLCVRGGRRVWEGVRMVGETWWVAVRGEGRTGERGRRGNEAAREAAERRARGEEERLMGGIEV